MTWRRGTAAAVLVVLVGSACGGGPGKGTSTSPPAPTSTTTAPASTTTTVAIAATVETIAELDISTGGIAVDTSGNVYVANIGPAPRRRGTRVYRVTPDGEITLHAEDDRLRGAAGNTVDAAGNLYQSAFTARAILRITPDGMVEPFADEGVTGPMGLVVDPAGGGLFAADCTAETVLHIAPDGETEVFADDPLLDCPTGLTMDEAGNLYVANFSNGLVLRVSPDGEVSELAVVPGRNNGHMVYTDGVLYVVGRGAHQIFAVSLDGDVDVLAGSGERGIDDGPADIASFSLPNGIAVGPNGSLYVNQVARTTGNQNFPTAVRVITIEE